MLEFLQLDSVLEHSCNNFNSTLIFQVVKMLIVYFWVDIHICVCVCACAGAGGDVCRAGGGG